MADYADGDTIAALSSRWGHSVRAVVRLSGRGALEIARKLFEPTELPLARAQSHTAHLGWLALGERLRCPCKLYLFRAPGSYTGQDLVELHLPGGPALVRMTLARLQNVGARMAQPGEFTLRAFLAGKVDLARAEAVAAIISSQTDAQLRAANSLAEGTLSRAVAGIQKILAQLIADLEANIDFVDQDIEFIDRAKALSRIEKLAGQVGNLLADALRWRDLQAEPRVVLAGWANVGKSTLLNALSGRSRAIVCGVAGTTRDVLMAPMRALDTNVLLIDAAGLGNKSLDEVGVAAREAALAAVRRADLVLYVIDATKEISLGQWQTLQMLEAPQVLIVANKMDLLNKEEQERILERLRKERQEMVLGVSAKSGEGLGRLRRHIKAKVKALELGVSAGRMVLTARAEEGLKQAQDALSRADGLLAGQRQIENPELVVMELYEANAALGTITGQISSEDVLEDIFSRFCVGK